MTAHDPSTPTETDPATTGGRGYLRRSVLATGAAASSGAILGVSTAAADEQPTDAAGDGAASTGANDPVTEAAMLSHQFVPGSRFRIATADVSWRPRALDGAADHDAGTDERYRTYAIDYDFSNSYRAFLFADPDLDPDRSYALGPRPTGTVASGRPIVTVAVEDVGGGG